MPDKEIKTGRPPGRPRKFDPRYHATTRLAPARYAELKDAADAAGRSISEEIEWRIERLATIESVTAAMRTTLEQIEKGSVAAALHRAGYVPRRYPGTRKVAWLEPGHPAIVGRSEFLPMAPGEAEALAARISPERNAEIEAGNDEKLQQANLGPAWDADAALDRLNKIAAEASNATPAPKKDDAA
jgi:hypothetical protein